MYTVIYLFKVKPDRVKNFIEAWRDLTLLIYKYEGSLGSRLHKQTETNYIAYAQWPDRNTWENSGSKLSETSSAIRTTLKETCEKIDILFELKVIEDMLERNPF